MSIFQIAWRNLLTRWVHTLLTAFIIATGVGLALTVVILAAGARRGLANAGGSFEIVVGPKGSAQQLVVSSVLYQDVPIGNFDYANYEELMKDARVRDAIPIGLGDNVAGLRLVGTMPELFTIRLTPAQPPFYQVAAGRAFSAEFEAVLGSMAARQLGLTIGDTLISAHGTMAEVNESEHAGSPYRVVGILAPTQTPADLAIYVSLDSIWEVHGIEHESHAGEDADIQPLEVTAVLVRGKDISSSYQIYQQINAGPRAQAALP
ncbi:MAG: ABC transporter permease, partial [Chloroflexi bacterium]|nr:ABC transporter permease [Chloroflexota bacterium]